MASYARYITPRSLARKSSPIRALTALQAQAGPEMISLAAGAPNPNLFPFEEMSIKMKGVDQNILLQGKQLNQALQYSPTKGYQPLLKHLIDMQISEHNYNPENQDICITTGSQDGLSKVLDAMVKRGDTVLVDSPIYSGTLAVLGPLGAKLVGIQTDTDGMNLDHLESVMKNQGKEAKILVTVTNGSNPSGGSLSLERRHRLLEIAEAYDLFIIEDDPYYWLSYDETRIPSLFKLESQKPYQELAPAGRVLRSDSFSKTISSGIRIGWQTGPAEIIDRVVKHTEASCMHSSTLGQGF